MTYFIGWFWFCVIIAAIVAVLAPTLLGGRFRLPYAAILSLVGLLLVGVLGWRGVYCFDHAGLGTGSLDFSGNREAFSLNFQYGSGGLMAGFWHFHDLTPLNRRDAPTGPAIILDPGLATRYPQVRDPVVKRWGFQLTWLSEPDRPGTSSIRHLWAVIMPLWFPVPFLLLFPSLFVWRRWVRPSRRRRQNRCVSCGYRLEGNVSGVCPECSTPVPAKPDAGRAVK